MPDRKIRFDEISRDLVVTQEDLNYLVTKQIEPVPIKLPPQHLIRSNVSSEFSAQWELWATPNYLSSYWVPGNDYTRDFVKAWELVDKPELWDVVLRAHRAAANSTDVYCCVINEDKASQITRHAESMSLAICLAWLEHRTGIRYEVCNEGGSDG